MALIEIEQGIEPLLKWPGGKFDELDSLPRQCPRLSNAILNPF